MSNPTQKQQLEEAQAKIADLEPKAAASAELQTKLDDATGKLTEANNRADNEKTRADEAEGKFSAEKTRADGLQEKLTASEASVGTLTGERDHEKKRADDAEAKVANADQRHQENSASRNIKPPQKDAKSVAAEGDAKPTAAQIKEQYAAIEDPKERYAFYQKHRSTLLS